MAVSLVTGASGFIGRRLVSVLRRRGHDVLQAVRRQSDAGENVFAVGELGPLTNWNPALERVDVVIHLAARAHILKDSMGDSLHQYRTTNVLGTRRLAEMAASSGVRRLIYISSIGVNGTQTESDAFTENDVPCPQDPYAISKYEAEKALSVVAGDTGLEIVILRPPLVYGPGNPGNFQRLLKLVYSGWPIPLRNVENRRSFIFVDNLVDAIIYCAERHDAAGQTYLVRDGEDVSTPELIQRLAQLMGRSSHLIPFPQTILHWGARMVGKSKELDRLTGSLIIDDTKIRSTLGWRPPYNLTHGLSETVSWFMK